MDACSHANSVRNRADFRAKSVYKALLDQFSADCWRALALQHHQMIFMTSYLYCRVAVRDKIYCLFKSRPTYNPTARHYIDVHALTKRGSSIGFNNARPVVSVVSPARPVIYPGDRTHSPPYLTDLGLWSRLCCSADA